MHNQPTFQLNPKQQTFLNPAPEASRIVPLTATSAISIGAYCLSSAGERPVQKLERHREKKQYKTMPGQHYQPVKWHSAMHANMVACAFLCGYKYVGYCIPRRNESSRECPAQMLCEQQSKQHKPGVPTIFIMLLLLLLLLPLLLCYHLETIIAAKSTALYSAAMCATSPALAAQRPHYVILRLLTLSDLIPACACHTFSVGCQIGTSAVP